MSFPSAQNLKNSLNDDEIISNIVKNMSLNTGNEITPGSKITIKHELTSVKDELSKYKSIILEQANILETNINTKKNLEQATSYYKDNLKDIDNKIQTIVQKEKLNKRISQFYNSDYDFKKTILYYLKIFYFIMVSLSVITIIYKKKHKEKKMYGFLFLLLIIPYFLISNIYKTILNNLGHLKIDVLYVIFLIIIGIITFGLFFISKYILKKNKGNLQDILKDTAENLKSKSAIIQ
tara:strand:+ start:4293 stop:5000 length:708 start_codon:yes stop_codon:yes gene_type:complete